MATRVKIDNGTNVNCFVPNCSNQKFVNGNPIHFFRVPQGGEGLHWKIAVNSTRSQYDKKIGILKRILPPSTLYCCELHFNIETDSIITIDANGTAECSIKSGIRPSVKPSRSRRLWEVLTGERREQSPEPDSDDADDDLLQPMDDLEETQCVSYFEVEEPINGCVLSSEKLEPHNVNVSLVDMSTFVCRNFEGNGLSPDQLNEIDDQIDIKFRPMMSLTMDLMKRKSSYYIGLEPSLFNRLLLIVNTSTSMITDTLLEMKIMLGLRKQRLNEEFEVLGDLFDIEKTTAEQYYTETKNLISNIYESLSKPKISVKPTFVRNPSWKKARRRHQSDDSEDQSSSSEQVDNDSDVVTDDLSEPSSDDSAESTPQTFLRDTVKCTMCHIRVYPDRLDSHMQNYHLNPLNLNKTVCGLCFEKFRSHRLLRDHQTEVHGGASCQCDICKKMFSKLIYVRTHMSEVHAKDRPFLCHLCGACYFRSSQLRIHTQSVHLKVRSFACKKCDKKYYQKTTLEAHILAVHNKERPFKCRFGCDKSFSRSNVRLTHEQMHKVKYSCTICSKVFSYKQNLQTHCKNIHGSNVIDPDKCKIVIRQ